MMEGTWTIIPNIAASGVQEAPGTIPLVRARTLTITTRLLYGASIDANTTLDLIYSPDGNNWDSLAYATASITYSAGATVQKTIIIDPPEHGYIKVKLTNGSSADVITNVRLWYSIQAWPPEPAQSHGDMSTRRKSD